MELEGKVFLKSDIEEGVSRAGRPWKKCTYVIETQEAYARKVAFTVFGEDRVNEMNNRISENMMVRVSFDLESREYNGRWYTDASAWRMEPINGTSTAPVTPAAQSYATPQQPIQPQGSPLPPPPIDNQSNDDLPF